MNISIERLNEIIDQEGKKAMGVGAIWGCDKMVGYMMAIGKIRQAIKKEIEGVKDALH